jgi:DNA-binding transcriptional regulator YbjK
MPSHAAPPDAPGAAAAPLGLDDDLPRLATRAVAMYQAIASVLAEPSTDCAAVTTKLGAIETANQDAITATAKVLHAGHDKIQRLRAALEPRQVELDASARTIAASAAMKACSSDPGFGLAIDHLLGEP